MTRRTDRVADAIQHTVAELLLREVKDPRIGLLTVTGAAVSPDLRHARIFFSVFGDDAQRQRTLAGLRSASRFIRAEVTHRLKLRLAPEIVFEFDPSVEQAERLARLLKESKPGPSDT